MLRVNLLPERENPAGEEEALSRAFEGLPRPGDVVNLASDPWGVALLGTAVVVLLAGGLGWYTQARHEARLEEALSAAVEDSTRLAELRALNDSLGARRDEVQRRAELVTRLDRGRFAWARMLHSLAAALPEPAWLTGIESEGSLPGLRLRVQGAAAGPLAVTAYLREMDGFRWVDDVALEATSRLAGGPPGAQSFILTVEHRLEAGPGGER